MNIGYILAPPFVFFILFQILFYIVVNFLSLVLANHWTDIVLLHSEAYHGTPVGYKLFGLQNWKVFKWF